MDLRMWGAVVLNKQRYVVLMRSRRRAHGPPLTRSRALRSRLFHVLARLRLICSRLLTSWQPQAGARAAVCTPDACSECFPVRARRHTGVLTHFVQDLAVTLATESVPFMDASRQSLDASSHIKTLHDTIGTRSR